MGMLLKSEMGSGEFATVATIEDTVLICCFANGKNMDNQQR